MNALYELKDMLCDELEQMMQKKSNINIDLVDKLTHSLKSIETIIAMHEADYGDSYSNNSYNRGNSYRGNSYRRSYDNGGSYGGYRMNRRGSNYSRDDGKHEMINDLHEMLNEVGSEKERNAIMQCIEKLENV